MFYLVFMLLFLERLSISLLDGLSIFLLEKLLFNFANSGVFRISKSTSSLESESNILEYKFFDNSGYGYFY